jgi:membrane fusion protein, multidrug efflux system
MKFMAMRSLWLGVLLAAGLFGIVGCAKRAATVDVPPPPEVTVSKPLVRQVTDYFEFPGQTAAVGEVEVRARVNGYLDKVNFEDGQNVKKGDLLYEIDPRPYQAALDRANGNLASLRALQAKAQLDLARSERLRPSGAVSQDEYEQRVAQLAVHKATIRSAEAAVRTAELDLEYTKIASPIDGRVSRTRVTKGNYVQPGADDNTVLTMVVTTDPIYVYFNVDEPTLLKYQQLAVQNGEPLHPGRLKDLKFPVEIGLENEKGFPHAGILDFADNRVDRGTGTLRVRGVFENVNEYLTPGLFVRVRIPFGKPHQALLVSERAVGTDQRIKYLLRVNPKNAVEYCPVTLGRLEDGMRVIESGIGPNDLVVVNGLQVAQQCLNTGRPVKPHPPTKKEAAAANSAANR